MRYLISLLVLLLFASFTFAQGRRVYVDAYATGAGNGTSWQNAFTDLQAALFAAQPGDQVWVALGIYKPTEGYNREISFRLKNGVQLFGGFSGVETELEQRNWERFKTTLSGNIGLADDNKDNSYTILFIEKSDKENVVDGFVFTGGRADNSDPFLSPYSNEKSGGAIYVMAEGSATYPVVRNCNFENNYAREFGGAVYLYTGEGKEEMLPFDNCWFVNNRADGIQKKIEAANNPTFRVYPNPATGMVTVEGEVVATAFPLQWTLFDAAGRQVQIMEIQQAAESFNTQIGLNELSSGWYNYRITDTDDALLHTGKLWKQ
ncbi:MAG TPA: T9SS type A sorting domain-containing protein [Saprospiraceae bacterium]|nr:T9SS type A sorting domain-containing protein [Saprospiraceae bacterium]